MYTRRHGFFVTILPLAFVVAGCPAEDKTQTDTAASVPTTDDPACELGRFDESTFDQACFQ